jgi:hypothetical protein
MNEEYFSETLSVEKKKLLKKNKEVEVSGVMTLIFNDKKLLTKVEIDCHVEFKN